MDKNSKYDSQDEYVVESIVDKRISNNIVEYRVKWRGYTDEENTWEPAVNLDCSDLKADFEDSFMKEDAIKVGFDRCLVAENIIGATKRSDGMYFLMKFKDSDVGNFVKATEANEKCPQIVIRYYEQITSWNTLKKLDCKQNEVSE